MEQTSNWNIPAACKGHLLTFNWKQQTTCQNLVWTPAWTQEHINCGHTNTHRETLPSNTFTLSSCWNFWLPLWCCHLLPELSLSHMAILPPAILPPAMSNGPSGHDSATLIRFASTLTPKSFFLSFLPLPHFPQLWLLRSFQQELNLVCHQPIFPSEKFFHHIWKTQLSKTALQAIQPATRKSSGISTMRIDP